MGQDFFRFKKFNVKQDAVAMKVGVDSVLLGAWTDTGLARRILDVGTGTGLLALMMAQRASGATIDAVEIDRDACRQARQNIANSPWSEQISVICDDFRKFADNCVFLYDLIISNPPFFTASLKPADNKRRTARHNDSLPQAALLYGATKLLAPDGLLSMVLPVVEADTLIGQTIDYALFVKRILHIQSFPSKAAHRMLIELSPKNGTKTEQRLCIENNDRNDYSNEYKDLTKDFYLNF